MTEPVDLEDVIINQGDRIAALEKELADEKKLHLGTAETHILIEKNLERQRDQLKEDLTDLKHDNATMLDAFGDTEEERDQLRQTVKQFVEEMDAQFPKLEMLPGEYDTLADMVK